MTLIPGAFPKTPQKPADNQITDDKDTSEISLKNVSSQKLYFCRCSLCDSVGTDYIIKQYQNFKDLLIEDRSSRVFDLFTEKVPGF